MHRLLIALVVSAALLLAPLGAGASEPRVEFSRLPAGWRATETYALSWRYHPDARGWANAMPPGAIAVEVLFLRKDLGYKPLRLTLPKRPYTTLEGAADTPTYLIKGRVQGRDVEIRVSIRRPTPTASQLREAQRVVAGIQFKPQ